MTHHPLPAPREIRVGGLRVHQVDAGPRAAHPVLLLPGIIATHRYYRANIGPLSQRFRVLAPDLPGFGRSDKPDAPYTTEWFVEQVARYLDAHGLERAHVVGNSLGGQIAMALALAHPARIERLVLVAPAGISTDRLRVLLPALGLLAAVDGPALRLAPRVPAAAWSMLFRAVFPGDPDLAARYTRGYARATASAEYALHLRSFVRAARGVLRSPMLARARSIAHRTLIVWGARDPLLPVAAAHRLHCALPSSELRIYPEAGHCPMLDHPARWNEDVTRFLEAP